MNYLMKLISGETIITMLAPVKSDIINTEGSKVFNLLSPRLVTKNMELGGNWIPGALDCEIPLPISMVIVYTNNIDPVLEEIYQFEMDKSKYEYM